MNLVDELHAVGRAQRRIEIDLPEGPLAVVSLATLLRMKRLAGRPQDVADIQALEALRAE